MHIRLNHTNATMLMVSIVVALLFVLNYSAAQWKPAPANPPSNNVAAPINVGNAEQTKAGILGVGGLGVNGNSVFSGSYIDYSFVRTGGASGNEPSKWRIRRNDGTSNWASYLNTDGGASPTLYASGNAFRQSYMPGSGIYSFEVSNTSGPAGATFSWNPAMRINPNGSVNIRQLNTNNICDANGNNCGGGGGGNALSSCDLAYRVRYHSGPLEWQKISLDGATNVGDWSSFNVLNLDDECNQQGDGGGCGIQMAIVCGSDELPPDPPQPSPSPTPAPTEPYSGYW